MKKRVKNTPHYSTKQVAHYEDGGSIKAKSSFRDVMLRLKQAVRNPNIVPMQMGVNLGYRRKSGASPMAQVLYAFGGPPIKRKPSTNG